MIRSLSSSYRKIKSFFDVLWFTALASIVSVVVIGYYLVTMYLSGNYEDYFITFIWGIVAFYSIRATVRKRRE